MEFWTTGLVRWSTISLTQSPNLHVHSSWWLGASLDNVFKHSWLCTYGMSGPPCASRVSCQRLFVCQRCYYTHTRTSPVFSCGGCSRPAFTWFERDSFTSLLCVGCFRPVFYLVWVGFLQQFSWLEHIECPSRPVASCLKFYPKLLPKPQKVPKWME